ncbi:MAG TPA: trypsin-like peptidase domain-containing protein [Verrucomicrobiae bacterium]|jgi:serine protease Do
MLDRFKVSILVAACGLHLAQAETIQLRDKASITGPVLAEKSDHVVVDLGFTVLSIPKSHIAKISKEQPPKEQAAGKPSGKTTPPAPASAPPPEAKTGLFSAATSPLPERSVRELVSRLGEGVVQVKTPGGLGSGFILNEEGYLITNFHVIEGETQITVEVYHQKNGQLDRKSYKQVKIVAMNKFQDLSLLKIEDKDASKFARVLLGDADAMAVGERVFAIGSPLGLERTVTEGILSTKTRQVQGGLYLQTTAQINPGNSGGPLFNMRGEVIGVTNMKLAFGEGIGFAIPVESVKFFLNHRDAYAYDNDNPNNPYRYLQPPSRIHQVLEESKTGKDSE